jgi:fructose-1,6-bisphosphatase/inositol monophosphatase family enzyme
MIPDIERVANVIREVAERELVPHFVTLSADDIGEKTPGDFVTAVDLAMERELAKATAAGLSGGG